MDLLDDMRRIFVFILLFKLTTSTNNSIEAVCNRTKDSYEWFNNSTSIPSPLYNLSVGLSPSKTSLIIRWSINIDGTIQSLSGTWISVKSIEFSSAYHFRCQYQPSFSSEQIILTGIQQLWFDFTVPDVSVRPSTEYYVTAYNLPNPKTREYIQERSYETKGCDWIPLLCDQWKADISSVLHGEKLVVIFMTSSLFDRYTIKLKNKTALLNSSQIKVGKEEKRKVDLMSPGPCEDLMITITAEFGYCQDECDVNHTVICMNRWQWAVGVCCGMLFLLILICFLITRDGRREAAGSECAECVQVLLVYPAVDRVFQRAVMLLAEFLQSCEDIRVTTDVWERESLAEHGVIRWLNTQVELADRVLLILPPQHAEGQKSNADPVVSHHTVSASASCLFALALSLVTSAACDPCGRDKFWVVHLEQHEEKRRVPAELRGCRMFVLPTDLQKLHHKLSGREELRSSARRRCFSLEARKLKEAVQQLEMNTACAQVVCLPEVQSSEQSPKLLL